MTPPASTRRLVLAVIAVLTCLSACTGKDTQAPRGGEPDHVANAVVIIHGVGNQTAGYSKPLQDLLKAKSASLHFVEVLWSDLGSALRQAEDPARANERQAAEQELINEINAAEQQASKTISPGVPQDDKQIRDEYAAARGLVSPIVAYEYLSPNERSRIQQRLRDALGQSAKHADKTYVIAHSLGTVIAYDVIHAWEGGTPPEKIVLLATMGSPLGKRIFAAHRGRPTGRPSNVEAWMNFHSPRDPIASPPLMGRYSDVEDRSVTTSVLPLSAHSAYWTHADVVSDVLNKIR